MIKICNSITDCIYYLFVIYNLEQSVDFFKISPQKHLSELYCNLVEFRDSIKKYKSREGLGFNPKALSMYLSISKLLDQALILPAHMIPDFQVGGN